MDAFLRDTLGLLNENIRNRTINELKGVFKEQRTNTSNTSNNTASNNKNKNLSANAATSTAAATANSSNSLLDDGNDEAELLGNTYPSPGGPTPGGDDVLEEDGVIGGTETTAGGPDETPGGPSEYEQLVAIGVYEAPVSQADWSRISEDQTNRINELKRELFDRNTEVNRLRERVGLMESEINTLKYDNKNNINRNNRDGKNMNNYSNSGDGVQEMKAQINDLKTMKLALIKSTSAEINHLRYDLFWFLFVCVCVFCNILFWMGKFCLRFCLFVAKWLGI